MRYLAPISSEHTEYKLSRGRCGKFQCATSRLCGLSCAHIEGAGDKFSLFQCATSRLLALNGSKAALDCSKMGFQCATSRLLALNFSCNI